MHGSGRQWDMFPCSGITDSILETEADISIDFVDCMNMFSHQDMYDFVPNKRWIVSVMIVLICCSL